MGEEAKQVLFKQIKTEKSLHCFLMLETRIPAIWGWHQNIVIWFGQDCYCCYCQIVIVNCYCYLTLLMISSSVLIRMILIP